MGSTGGNNNSELATLKTEMNRVESNYQALQVIHHTLEQNFESRNNEISSLSAEKDTLVQQNKAWEEKNKEWEKKNEELKNKIKKSADDLSAQAKEIEELTKKLGDAQNNQATAIEKLNAEQQKLEGAKKEFETKFQVLEDEKDSVILSCDRQLEGCSIDIPRSAICTSQGDQGTK